MIRRLAAGAALVALIGTTLTVRMAAGGEARAYSPLGQLAPTTSGIHLVEMFNYNVSNHAADERGHVDYVWSATAYERVHDEQVPGVKHDWYTLFARNDNGDTGHDFAWFQANHPDWIEYRCNRTTPVYGKTWVAFDISNPATQAYQLSYITRAMNGGYNGVDFDVTDTFNYLHVCGHYDANGHWVRQFSGRIVDQTYRRMMIATFRSLTGRIRAAAEAANIPFTIGINPNFDTALPGKQVEDLFPYADVILDEAGLTNYGYQGDRDRVLADAATGTRNQWLSKMHWYRDLHRMGKVLILGGGVPYRISASHPARESDRQWILANYLLTKDAHTYQALISGYQQYGGPYYPQPEYHIDIGAPLGGMHHRQGVWERRYTNGLVLVNPSPVATIRVHLPARRYRDYADHLMGRGVTLGPGSGRILLVNQSRPAAAPPAVPSSSMHPAGRTTLMHLIRNGGFGAQAADWQQTSPARTQIVDGTHTHKGWYAGDLCGYAGCRELLSQTVTLPAHFIRVRVHYWRELVAPAGLEASTPTTFVAQIRDASRHRVVTFGHLHGALRTTEWSQHMADLTSALLPYRGQTVQIVFAAKASSAHPASIYVDSVSLNALVRG